MTYKRETERRPRYPRFELPESMRKTIPLQASVEPKKRKVDWDLVLTVAFVVILGISCQAVSTGNGLVVLGLFGIYIILGAIYLIK